MIQLADPASPDTQAPDRLIGESLPSPAGPLEPGEAVGLPEPPAIIQARPLQTPRFIQRQIELVFRARRELGDILPAPGPHPFRRVAVPLVAAILDRAQGRLDLPSEPLVLKRELQCPSGPLGQF